MTDNFTHETEQVKEVQHLRGLLAEALSLIERLVDAEVGGELELDATEFMSRVGR